MRTSTLLTLPLLLVACQDGRPPVASASNARASAITVQSQPTGGKIAFTSDRGGNYEIYVINADGSGETRLTNNSAYDAEPAWSR